LEAAIDGIITMDHEGRITEFNAAAEKIFGYTRAEVLGRTVGDMLIPATLREAHRRGLAQCLATGEGPVMGRRIESTALRADGTEFPAELAVCRVDPQEPPVFTVYVRDLTEQRRVEAERSQLVAIVESSNDAIIGETVDGRIVNWNASAERIYGYKAEE